MKTIYSEKHSLHYGTELKDGNITPSFEKPDRAHIILDHVTKSGIGEVLSEKEFPKDYYILAHSKDYVRFLETAWDEWKSLGNSHDALPLVWPVRDLNSKIEPATIDGKLGFYSMDAGAPITQGTWEAVKSSANTALTAMELILNGEGSAFALCRPPGHHAAKQYMGGYCYLNNAAIAAEYALKNGAKKVAILDVDFHHGNGTQNIFYDRNDVMFLSIHGDPSVSYPYFSGSREECGAGEGYGYNKNYPLDKGTNWHSYREVLKNAISEIVNYNPEYFIVSLGVDTFEGDPISHFKIRTKDYLEMGEILKSVGVSTLFVMEGGYMVDEIGANVVNVLNGYEKN